MIKFGTGGWRAIIADGFTKENIRLLTAGLCALMEKEGHAGAEICVGYDRRFLSKESAHWACEVLAGYGFRPYVINRSSPTPLIMFTVKRRNMPYGMAVTASHNPAIYNGIKVFTEGGRDADAEVTRRIEAEIEKLSPADVKSVDYDTALAEGKIVEGNPMNEYLDSILSAVNVEAIKKASLRIGFDPMYGVSWSSLSMLLTTCRCDLEVIHDRHDTLFGGKLPADRTETAFDADLKAMAAATVPKVEEKMDNMLFSDALIEIWNLIRRTNKYIDETQPWVLCKDEAKKAELANALYNVAESIRIISILIQPFMPLTPAKIWAQLNITEGALTDWESTKTWGLLPAELTVTKGETLFPRIDMKKELESLEAAIKAAQATSLANQAKKEEPKKEAPEEEYPAEITIDDFCKVQLKVGEVIESKEVPKSKKLLRNVVKFGEEERVIFSGIKDTYAPGELVGKRVVVAYNLKPRKMMGEMSYGMILCAEDKDGKLSILTTDDKDFESGSSIS